MSRCGWCGDSDVFMPPFCGACWDARAEGAVSAPNTPRFRAYHASIERSNQIRAAKAAERYRQWLSERQVETDRSAAVRRETKRRRERDIAWQVRHALRRQAAIVFEWHPEPWLAHVLNERTTPIWEMEPYY